MELLEEVDFYQQLRFEQDKRPKEDLNTLSEDDLKKLLEELKIEKPCDDEPSSLVQIIKKSKFEDLSLDVNDIENRIKGAIIGRFAGCLLGVPVEMYPIEKMEQIAKEGGTPFPPTEYWHKVDREDTIQYGVDRRGNYTLDGINAVFVDDDIIYTVLNVLLIKKYGKDYTLDDVAQLWLDLLPYACTAEREALSELNNGTKPALVANNNPFTEWIGAAIRADAFGYVFAGRPAEAAKAAYNDAYLTHRRNGIYGEMYLAAAISLSFCMHPHQAIVKALDYIPTKSRLHKDIEWVLSLKDKNLNYKEARKLIDERFVGMKNPHTLNNLCIIAFVTMIAGDSYTNAISTAVAFGIDNDCTAATLGSMFGAYFGFQGVDEKWYKNFNDTIHTYLKGYENISLSGFIQDTVDLYKKYQ